MGANSIALIPSACEVTKSHDTEYPFRQDSNFRYLTGFLEPDCTLVLVTDSENILSEYLFLREKDPFMELWMGERVGTSKAKELFDMNDAFSHKTLEEKIIELATGTQKIFYDLSHPSMGSLALHCFNSLQKRRKIKEHKPTTFSHLTPLLGRLRLIKDDSEIVALKKAMEKTSLAHQYAMSMTTSKSDENAVNNMMNFIFNSDNAEGPAYDSIIAGGQNALTLHYIKNNQVFKEGDLVLIDAGAQYNGMASDVSRTYPVNGKFSTAQKEIYQLVLDSQKASLREAKTGGNLPKMHEAVCRVLSEGLINLGIIKSSDELKKYYPHGTGHWLGLDVHDVCPYLDQENNDITFLPGMVFTCEPGLYFPVGDQNVPEKYQGIGIRIEDDILITEKGYENLSAMIPKEIAEVENICQKDPSSFSLYLH